jgi:putative molybdopterin biosynthesis protein
MAPSSELSNAVGARRKAVGVSVTLLAERVGVSRQALTAVEAGRSTPSTAIALRLAAALSCTVEELFALPVAAVPGLRVPELAGRRVALARVDGRWAAHGLDPRRADAADGIVLASGGVEPLGVLDELASSVLVAGCAPVLGALAARTGRTGEAGARWLPRSSGASLRALAQGRVHVAGMHLAAHDRPDEHERLVREHLSGQGVTLVSLVLWREGLAFPKANPRQIQGAVDLALPNLRIGRRPKGSGAAAVLDGALARAGLSACEVEGARLATHMDAAHAVLHGAVDVAVLVEPVAQAFGLGFVPLSEERFELVVRTEHLAHRGVRRLLDQLTGPRYARDVRGMGAYDTAELGQMRQVAG